MFETSQTALKRGVIIGAHIGYPDREGFGRRAFKMSSRELELMTLAQLGALSAIANHAGHRLTHANFHGALGNLSFVDQDVARTVVQAVKAFDPSLIFIGLPHTQAYFEAERAGLKTVRSFLADRGYLPSGVLAARGVEGALIKDVDAVRQRLRRVLLEGVVEAVDGSMVEMPIDSVLVHSDTPGAVSLAEVIRDTVVSIGMTVRSFT